MPEEQPTPNYRTYSWEDETTGTRHVVAYASDEEASDERKEQMRARARRVLTGPVDGQAGQNARPALRLVRGDGS
ncbi:hypothetical protein [Kitasatospora sp. NPDC054795]